MALAHILPSTAPQDITFAAQSMKTIWSSVRVRSNIGQLDGTTFGNEDTGDFVAGTERLTLLYGGVMKTGAAQAAPLIPLSAQQNIAFDIIFKSGNHISGTQNLSEVELGAVVGNLRTITAQGFSLGAFVVTWVVT